MDFIKSIQISDSRISVTQVPIPDCSGGGVIIRLEACGICGSDIANVFGSSCKPSTKIGHEISGTIITVSSEVEGFKAGDRVFVHHHAPCNSCRLCERGNETMCERFVDSLYPSGLSEMFFLPLWNINQGCLFKIPSTMSFEEAALIEPLACCTRAWKKISKDVNTVAVFGLGTIGIFHALLAKIYGIEKIFCIDVNEFRLDFCKSKKLGSTFNTNDDYTSHIFSETGSLGVDLVIIAAPDISTINDAIKIVRKGGKILLMGEPKNNELIGVDLSVVYTKEISILTSYAASNKDAQDALDTIKSGLIDVSQLITHRFSLDECEKALHVAREKKDSIKVVIVNKDSQTCNHSGY